ncbi:cysteine-rich and transmembrane domain-containing protein WIH2-like [Cucumis sativus]|uniref:cysteine-rich and transmembrane domain-containing protein WIH2-like n=1 Tax=Cucumis sativus TaxID=3659 RepID=UPI0012F4E42F|nr:cysteine-rich and transmembrane domain-containing protein WIH2-like [Cucumis sativus]KAE8645841.1 hypothetical protein Csa_017279 [Cucumis sativus]
MSYYNQPPPSVGVPPPPHGYPLSTMTPSGYPLQGGYPPQGYPPPSTHGHPPPQHVHQDQKKDGCFKRWFYEILSWTP